MTRVLADTAKLTDITQAFGQKLGTTLFIYAPTFKNFFSLFAGQFSAPSHTFCPLLPTF